MRLERFRNRCGRVGKIDIAASQIILLSGKKRRSGRGRKKGYACDILILSRPLSCHGPTGLRRALCWTGGRKLCMCAIPAGAGSF